MTSFNRSVAMRPPATVHSSSGKERAMVFQSLKHDGAFFHWVTRLKSTPSAPCFNRSSGMWPTSTPSAATTAQFLVSFQSLKRDVAYFHIHLCLYAAELSDVSIAQARC